MGRVQTRFEIGHHVEGLIDTETTLREAQAHALRWAMSNTGYSDALREVRIYDSMARIGQTTKWCFDVGSKSRQGIGQRIA